MNCAVWSRAALDVAVPKGDIGCRGQAVPALVSHSSTPAIQGKHAGQTLLELAGAGKGAKGGSAKSARVRPKLAAKAGIAKKPSKRKTTAEVRETHTAFSCASAATLPQTDAVARGAAA